MTYEQECEAAIDEQGLRAPREALRAVGHEPDVEQTGGMVMVLYVNRSLDTARLGVTVSCEVDDRDLFMVCFYRDEDADGETISEACDLHALIWLAHAFKRGVLG